MRTLTNLKKKTLFVVFAALLAFLSVGTSFAHKHADGSSPNQALTPGSEHSLKAGESVWYAFDYGLDVDGNPVEVSIWVEGYPTSGTNFEVWTTQRLQEWQRQEAGDDSVKPIGLGSENDNVAGNYSWRGSFYQADKYYVLVKNGTSAESTHTLHVTGDTVMLSKAAAEESETPAAEATETPAAEESETPAAEATETPAAEATETPAAEATETPAAEATETPAAEAPSEEAATGTSPENALRMTGEWKELQAGGHVWYAFDYIYDSGNPRQASVWMNSVPDNGINFEIWTPESLQQQSRYPLNNDINPVGRGSKNDNTPSDYYWSGGFSQSGTYYVRVKNMNSTVGYYELHINSGN